MPKEIKEQLREFFKAIKGDKFFHPFPFTKKTIDKITKADKDIYSVAIEEEKITGMFMLRGFDEGYDIPSFGIIIHPDYRGRGMGTSGLEEAIKICKRLECKKIRLTVDEDNKIAKRIYKKAGFKFNKNIGFKTL